jgi:spoIIIJ-associated protein
VSEPLEVEATGETVGEAKWLALRELEKLQPGLDKAAVRFQVVSEGQRGLLGVGYAPARVLARVEAAVAAPAEVRDESPLAARVREVLERITQGIGVRCRIEIEEREEELSATLRSTGLGLVIGKHGQTIDAIQYLVNAIVHKGAEVRKPVVVDAGGYRDRRQATLDGLAVRSAEQVRATGEAVRLEPMSSVERKLVHLRLQDEPGVATRSEGDEPYRYVVVEPAASAARSGEGTGGGDFGEPGSSRDGSA